MIADAPSVLVARAQSVIEQVLDEERPGWERDEALVARARALSEAFTSEGPTVTPSATVEVAHAYLAYFAPRTVAAVASALSFAPVPERVVDVGAGTGAAALVFAAAGAREVLLVDHDPAALERARALLERLPAAHRPRSVTSLALDLHAPRPLPVSDHALVSAFTLGELLPGGDAEAVLDGLLTLAPKTDRLFLVDAGDRRRARRLQELRAAALARGWHVRAPCPHEGPCPALERRRDWCHLRAERRLSERLARFAEAVGRDPLALSYSFVDLVSDELAHEDHQVLVIGEARREKGRVRLPVCGAGGLRFLQALKRDREAHDALLTLERGAVVRDVGWERRADTAHVVDASALHSDADDAKLRP